VVCSKDDFVKGVLRHKSLKFLGLISYSIYLSHEFVLWICNQFVRMVLRRPEVVVEGNSTPQLSAIGALIWQLIAVTATLLLSALVFRYVEDPCRLKSKEFVRRRMTPDGRRTRVAVNQG
jgi:peptidoglycan/LPS O-acetylase OafA/YrhL